MKHPTFYLSGEDLEQYLNEYGADPETKDYELVVALHAIHYFGELFDEKLYVAFETNNKLKDPINGSGLTMERLRKIMLENLAENTDVDFCLAPTRSIETKGYAFPFQLKRFYLDSKENPVDALSEFINTKANEYSTEKTAIIFVPLQREKIYSNGFSIKEVKERISIRDNAAWAVYLYQVVDKKPKFVPLWASSRALKGK